MTHTFYIRNHPYSPNLNCVEVREADKGFVGYLSCVPHVVSYTTWFRSIANAQGYIDTYKENAGKVMTTPNDSQLRGIIDNALTDLVNNQSMFTAYDVTRAVRTREPSLHIYHDVVKAYVHNKFESGDGAFAALYDRSLANFGNPPPWVYYVPGNHNPSCYTALSAVPLTPQPKQGPRTLVATFGGIRASD